MNYRTGVSVSNTSPSVSRLRPISSPPYQQAQQITALQYLFQYSSQSTVSPRQSLSPLRPDQSETLVENIRALIREATNRGLRMRQIIAGLNNLIKQKDFVIEYSRFSTEDLSRAVDQALDGTILECNSHQGLQESKSPIPTGSTRVAMPSTISYQQGIYDRAAMPYDQSSRSSPTQPYSNPSRSPTLRSKPTGGVASVVISTGH